MFRFENGKDITDEEVDSILIPHSRKCIKFMSEFVIPEFIAFYLASGYYDSALWEASFDIHINDSLNNFNCSINNRNELKKNIEKVLYTKYSLKIVCDSPLNFEKI